MDYELAWKTLKNEMIILNNRIEEAGCNLFDNPGYEIIKLFEQKIKLIESMCE